MANNVPTFKIQPFYKHSLIPVSVCHNKPAGLSASVSEKWSAHLQTLMSSSVHELEKGFDMHNVPNSPLRQVTAFFLFFFFCDWGNRFIRFIRINYCCSHKIREASCGTPLKNNLLETSLNQEWFPRGKHPEEESLCKWWYNKSGGVVCLPWVMHFAYSAECLQTKGLQKVENSQQDKLSSIRWIVIGLYHLFFKSDEFPPKWPVYCLLICLHDPFII